MSIKILKDNKSYINVLDTKYNFKEFFNKKTKALLRTNIIKDGIETKDKPSMRSFPYHISIGIVGSCSTFNDNQCGCGGCYYRNRTNENNLSLEQIKTILKEAKEKGTLIVELVGAGNPDEHPDILEILDIIHGYKMACMITTSGYKLSDEIVKRIKKYNFFVCLSWYNKKYSIDALKKLIDNKCTISLYLLASRENIKNIIKIIKTSKVEVEDEKINLRNLEDFHIEVNQYEPVGLGTVENTLNEIEDKESITALLEAKKANKSLYIYLDPCSVPGIFESEDLCVHGSMSAIITPDYRITPCSHEPDFASALSLNDYTIEEAWNSEVFENFRNGHKIENGKVTCPVYKKLKEAGKL